MIVKAKRLKLWQRDGLGCHFCGDQSGLLADLTIDHLVPVSRGGTNDLGNLVLACRRCNFAKGPLTYTEFQRIKDDPDALAKLKTLVNRELMDAPLPKRKFCSRCKVGWHGSCTAGSKCGCPEADCTYGKAVAL